jgi:hypothetical protein
MIPVSSVIKRMEAALDAEGSDRYLWDQDYKPAIQYSIDFIVSVFNTAFGEKKFAPENLRDLKYTKVFQANQFSRIDTSLLSSINHSLWTIISVSPEPKVHPVTTPPSQVNPLTSVLRNDLIYVSGKYASLITDEVWSKGESNIFIAGNNVQSKSFLDYGYKSHGNVSGVSEIEIRPSVAGKFVGIEYIKTPSYPSTQQGNIEFPDSLVNLITELALKYISFKQGDRTSLYLVTSQDVASLVKLMN